MMFRKFENKQIQNVDTKTGGNLFLATPTKRQTIDKPSTNPKLIQCESEWKQNTVYDHDVKGLMFLA